MPLQTSRLWNPQYMEVIFDNLGGTKFDGDRIHHIRDTSNFCKSYAFELGFMQTNDYGFYETSYTTRVVTLKVCSHTTIHSTKSRNYGITEHVVVQQPQGICEHMVVFTYKSTWY